MIGGLSRAGIVQWDEMTQAIPPAYTEFVGVQLLQAIEHTGAKR